MPVLFRPEKNWASIDRKVRRSITKNSLPNKLLPSKPPTVFIGCQLHSAALCSMNNINLLQLVAIRKENSNELSIKFQLHEYDDCRFDVHVNDNIYYLRSKDVDEKNKWTTTIEAAKVS